MSRKKLQTGSTTKKALGFNSLLQQLETPRSFVNLLPEDTRTAVISLPDNLINIDEEELLLRAPKLAPTAVMDALRFNFWMEHDRVVTSKTEMMNMSTVYFGVCTREYWHKIITEMPEAMCYILCRPPQYLAMMNSLSNQWTKRLRDILNIPIKKPNGEYQDPKVLDLILKAGAMVDLRTQGGYITRTENKNLNLTHTKNESVTKLFSAASSNKSVAEIEVEIDQRMKLLEQELQHVPATPNFTDQKPRAIDNTVVDAEFSEVKRQVE